MPLRLNIQQKNLIWNNIIHLNINLIKKVWKYSCISERDWCLFVFCWNLDEASYLWLRRFWQACSIVHLAPKILPTQRALALRVVMQNSNSLMHDAFGLTKSDGQRYNALSRFRQHTNKHQSCSLIHEYFHTFLILFMYKCIILFHI